MSDRRALLLGRRGRFILAVLPLIAAFALAEWFVITGTGSFTGLLNFLGVIVVSLLAGLYPVLLYVASRRKGEYAPGAVSSFLGRPALLGAVYVLFLGALFAHGLVIWDGPVERVFAFAAGAAMLAIPAALARGGAFGRRLTIELRDDQGAGGARFAYLSGERPMSGQVRLEYADGERRPEGLAGEIPAFDSLRRAVFAVRRGERARPDQVKVWAHRVTPERESESLSATAAARAGGQVDAADLSLSHGEAIFSLEGSDAEIEIVLKGRDEG